MSAVRTPVGHGLYNSGNYCYQNAVLLCLLHQPAFCNYVTGSFNKMVCQTDQASQCTTCALVTLVTRYWAPTLTDQPTPDLLPQIKDLMDAICQNAQDDHPNSSVVGEDLKQDFLGGCQSDAYDFLLYLVRMLRAQIEHDLKSIAHLTTPEDEQTAFAVATGLAYDKSRLNVLFKISLESQWTCTECSNFTHLRAGIDDQPDGLAADVTNPGCGLLLETYLQHNVFDEDKEIRCDSEHCLQRSGCDSTSPLSIMKVQFVVTSRTQSLVPPRSSLRNRSVFLKSSTTMERRNLTKMKESRRKS